VFASAFFPWSAIVLGRAADIIRRGFAALRVSPDEKLLWLWTLGVGVFFSAARFKLDHYIFPAAPTCCLLAANAWRQSARDTDSRTSGTRMSVLITAGLLIVGGSFSSVYLFELNLELPATAILLPLALVAGGIVLMTQAALRGWKTPRHATALIAMLLTSYFVVTSVGYPVLEQTRPTALVARRLRRISGADAPTGLYKLERWRSSLRYYLDRPIERLEQPEEASAFFAQSRPVYVVMLRREYDALVKRGLPIRLVVQQRAVVGTTGTGLRRQRWGFLVVATNAPPPSM
jgi:hypothetical protein